MHDKKYLPQIVKKIRNRWKLNQKRRKRTQVDGRVRKEDVLTGANEEGKKNGISGWKEMLIKRKRRGKRKGESRWKCEKNRR